MKRKNYYQREINIKSRKPWFIRLSGLVISNWDFPYRNRDIYKGEKYIRCADCGILVRRTSNRTKYCKDCSAQKQLEWDLAYKHKIRGIV